jgi:hypothetical protein
LSDGPEDNVIPFKQISEDTIAQMKREYKTDRIFCGYLLTPEDGGQPIIAVYHGEGITYTDRLTIIDTMEELKREACT